MNKKWTIISIVVLIVTIFTLINIFDEPEEFQVEDVMFDRSGEMMN